MAMPQSQYLLYVDTSPKGASDESWAKWFASQHLPTLAKAKACTRVALYKETALAMLPETEHSVRFLALYENDQDALQNDDAYQPASPEEESDVRNYRLLQDFNPGRLNDDPSPNILTTEMNPLDAKDFEDWYRTDLLPRISRLQGYRRSRRYQLSAGCENSDETFLGRDYLAIHGFDDLNKAFANEKQHRDNLTVRTEKQIQESEATGGFIRRGWKLVHARTLVE